MPLDPLLQEILVDPEDKEPLFYFEDDAVLYNPRLRRSYPVRDGIPVLLIGEATSVSSEAHDEFMARRDEAITTGRGAKDN